MSPVRMMLLAWVLSIFAPAIGGVVGLVVGILALLLAVFVLAETIWFIVYAFTGRPQRTMEWVAWMRKNVHRA